MVETTVIILKRKYKTPFIVKGKEGLLLCYERVEPMTINYKKWLKDMVGTDHRYIYMSRRISNIEFFGLINEVNFIDE